MNSALENLSKTDLLILLEKEKKAARNSKQHLRRTVESYEKRLLQKTQHERYLKDQIAQLQRMLFGQKRERFEGNPNQVLWTVECLH